jgi:hypothetical protein
MVKNLGDDFTPAPYVPADAVTPCARPGYKAGNPYLDDVLKRIREDNIVKRFKDFYTKIFKKK